MKKTIKILIIATITLIIAFFLTPKFEKKYLISKYINGETYTEIIDFNSEDIEFYNFMLSKKEELEKTGGVQGQLEHAIGKSKVKITKELIKNHKVNVTSIIDKNTNLINNILKTSNVDLFEIIVNSIDKDKIASILERIFLKELSIELESKGKAISFFNNRIAMDKFLSEYHPSPNNTNILSLLNYAVGSAKDSLVKSLLDYGVSAVGTNDGETSPIEAFFLLTPDNSEKKESAAELMKEVIPAKEQKEKNIKLVIDIISRQEQQVNNYLKGNASFSLAQQEFFKKKAKEKSNILKYLIEKGLDINKAKVVELTPFELLASLGVSEVFIPMLKDKIKVETEQLILIAVRKIDLPLFSAIVDNYKPNLKWKSKRKETLLMVLLNYDIVRRNHISQYQRVSDIINSRLNENNPLAQTMYENEKITRKSNLTKSVKNTLRKQRDIATILLKAGVNPNDTNTEGYSAVDYLFPNQMPKPSFSVRINDSYEPLFKGLKDSELMLNLLIDNGLLKKTKLKYSTMNPVNSFFPIKSNYGSVENYLRN